MPRSFAPRPGPPDVTDVLRRGARRLPRTQRQSVVDLLDELRDSAAARKHGKNKVAVRQARFKALRGLRGSLAEDMLGLDPSTLHFLAEYYMAPAIDETIADDDGLLRRIQDHVAAVFQMTREQVSARHADLMSRLASGARRLELHRRNQDWKLIVARYVTIPSEPEASERAAALRAAENQRAELDAMRRILADFLPAASTSPTI